MNAWIAKMKPVWARELKKAQKKPRKLVKEPADEGRGFFDQEICIMCRKRRTLLWLQPENAPLCGDDCMKKYLKDPTVYDPRGLYGPPNIGKKES